MRTSGPSLRTPPRTPIAPRPLWLLAAALLALPAAAPAALYKWIDENGNVTFSDEPPPEGQGRAVEKLRDEVPRHEPPPPRDAFLPEPEPGESPEYTGEPPPEPEERYSCEEARHYVAIHENRRDKEMYAPVGEKEFEPLDPQAIEGMLEAWRAVRDRVCGGAPEEAAADGG